MFIKTWVRLSPLQLYSGYKRVSGDPRFVYVLRFPPQVLASGAVRDMLPAGAPTRFFEVILVAAFAWDLLVEVLEDFLLVQAFFRLGWPEVGF